MAGKRCQIGKSCGATCIDRAERCELELGPVFQASLPQARQLIERVQGKLNQTIQGEKPITTEKEVVEEVKNTYKKWLTGGMEERMYGGPGQRGNPESKFWLLGQEGYANDARVEKGKENDPINIVNTLRLQNRLYDIAKKEGVEINPTSGIESVMEKKPFHLDKNTTVEEWAKYSGSSYYGRLGKMAKELGYSGDVLGANVSSFMMPSGQKGLDNLTKLLKRNNVDVNTFADGAFKNKEAWYQASVNARLPLMVKGIKRYKPEIVYIGQTASPEQKKFATMLLYTASQKLGLPVYNINNNGVNYNYMVIPLPGGKHTVVINSWHPTGLRLPGQGAVNKEIGYATQLMRSLKDTGKPPAGIVANPVSTDTMNKVLGTVKNKDVSVTPKPMRVPAEKIAKQTQKEMGAGEAKQKLVGYVQTLRNQGQKDIQIRETLRKLGIPGGLITELI